MSLPNINITYNNGALGSVVPLADGVFGVVTLAAPVGATFALETHYVVKSMQDVAALGIVDSVPNHILYKFLNEFFAEAGSGTELHLMAFAKTTATPTAVKMSDLFTSTGGVIPATKLLDAANGKLRGLFALFNPDTTYTPVITNGIDADVTATKSLMQTLLDDYSISKKAPMFGVIDGYGFSGTHTALPDLTTESNDRVSILLGDTEKRTGLTASQGSALGLLAGRLAKYQVQVNIGKVANGPVSSPNLYILDTPCEQYDVESLHDKGYITFRTHIGRSGYYFTDDPQACLPSNDYRHITNRRVIDKAYRIAYDVLLNYLLDDVQVTKEGKISPIYAKTIEGRIVNTIYQQMTANGELSADLTDNSDKGAFCKIDLEYNVISNSKIKLDYLRVLPKGYARYIDVPLGFVPIN